MAATMTSAAHRATFNSRLIDRKFEVFLGRDHVIKNGRHDFGNPSVITKIVNSENNGEIAFLTIADAKALAASLIAVADEAEAESAKESMAC